MKMKNTTYDILKFVDMKVLPALLTFYGIIGATLNIPYTQEVLTIGAGLITCLGTILGISNANYNKTISLEELSDNKGEE